MFVSKEKYQSLIDFVNSERQKPECLCKKTEKALEEMVSIENSWLTMLLKEYNWKEFSSGRKIKQFDQFGRFSYFILKGGFPIIIKEDNFDKLLQLSEYHITFSPEEIESYARAYRIAPLGEYFENCSPRFIQIYDFKPPKI